jgi:peptidoglycan/LPS O-acetylase OafA/YrhL
VENNKVEIRKDIQLLRGLAVVTVVLFHLQAPFFQNGFLGVDIFFVISGFLMAKLYDKGTILDFYKRRLDRLYPAYALTLLVTLLVGTFF